MDQAQWVGIGEAAALTGTTPNAIRHFHRTGLLPEPERGRGERRRYGYEDVVRILWVRAVIELGLPEAGPRAAEEGAAGRDDPLTELEVSLERRRERAGELLSAVRRLRACGGDLRRSEAGVARAAGLATQAAGQWTSTLHPRLRAEQRRLEVEIEVLSDPRFPPDDPRVVALAHDFSVHLLALEAAERAADFPEPDFIDSPPTAPPPGAPSHVLTLPGTLSPALARVAELLSPHRPPP
ncbi:MerR family transcriptional regulator [Streptomyces sp. A1136]|uniref:MerR family transcriptional regulator n=1 Tax=Streptomyces sp. A1136 TaxID=2563102 RepID=UPI00109E8EA9|nr:MerR family transcriptional regulator [Streptomyces sp. A1136]THA55138.1 MerR family transcriptional regulator [Streptomyces sp. A1136]